MTLISIPTIPQELVDAIIDLLGNDCGALRTCALVCRAWLPRSHLHLFKHISIGDGIDTPIKFLQLLESSSLSFHPLVRSLSLREGRGRFPHETKWLDIVLPTLTFFTAVESVTMCFIRIAHSPSISLENVRGPPEELDGTVLRATGSNSSIPLSISSIVGTLRTRKSEILDADATGDLDLRKRTLQHCLPNQLLVSTLSGFKMLKSLTLERVHFWTFAQFVDILGTCPQILHMALKMVSWVKPTPSPMLSVASSSQNVLAHLLTLEVSSCDVIMLLDWILHFERAPELSKFSLSAILSRETALIGAFMRDLATSLTQLELEFLPDNDPSVYDSFCRDVNLAVNTQLRRIRFNSISLWQPENLDWISSILSQICSPMEEVEFSFTLTVPKHLDDSVDWAALEDVFAKPSWVGLQRIAFARFNSDNGIRPALEMLIRNNLPRCARRGLLFWKRFDEEYKDSWESFDLRGASEISF